MHISDVFIENGDDSIDQKEFMSLFEDSVDSLQRQVRVIAARPLDLRRDALLQAATKEYQL